MIGRFFAWVFSVPFDRNIIHMPDSAFRRPTYWTAARRRKSKRAN